MMPARASIWIVAAVLVLTATTTHADVAKFEGAWGVEHCRPNRPKDECGGFYLYLVQRGIRICGDHFMATPGLGRLNEGGPRSVMGTVVGSTAIVEVTSGRDGTRYLARARRVNDKLEWKLLEELHKGGAGDSPLVADKATLTRQKTDESLARAAEDCKEFFENPL
jgi:hypothetical protein